MKITAVTKFKHGLLLDALRQAGITASALADKIGIARTTMSSFMCLRIKPSLPTATKILAGLAELGIVLSFEEVWPEEFKPSGLSMTLEQSREVEAALLNRYLQYETDRLLTNGEEPPEIPNYVSMALEALTPLQQKVIDLHCEGYSWAEIGRKINLSHTRAENIFRTATHKIQNKLTFSENLKGTGVKVTPELLKYVVS